MKEIITLIIMISVFVALALCWENLPPIANWVIYFGTVLILTAIAFHYYFYE